MIKLLNTDCLGNALTKDKASTYNVKFIKNNCCNFNGTSDYICLCDDATVLLGADKIAICFETTTVSYSTIAINLFLDDLNGDGDKIELRNSTTIRWYSNHSSTDYTVPAYNDTGAPLSKFPEESEYHSSEQIPDLSPPRTRYPQVLFCVHHPKEIFQKHRSSPAGLWVLHETFSAPQPEKHPASSVLWTFYSAV